MRELTLLIPGLSGPRGAGGVAFERLRLAALEQMVARAERVPAVEAGLEAMLLDAFGLKGGIGEELPVAPLALFGETGERPAGTWLRADPVHIEAGMDKAVMRGGAVLGISREEADALCEEINAQMEAEGLRVRAPSPARWYAAWPHAPGATFSALPEVLGADLFHHMPGGEAGRDWRRLLNHAQMVLHASPVNRRRRAEGRTEINGLWFWGAGELPAVPVSTWAAIWGDDPLVRGLALSGGVRGAALPPEAGQWLREASQGTHLAVIDRLREPLGLADLEGWRARMEEVHRGWFEPLRGALLGGGLDRLRICPGDGAEYHISRRAMRWRWWRRGRPLHARGSPDRRGNG